MYTFGLRSPAGAGNTYILVDTQLEFITLDELTELCVDELEVTALEIIPEEPA